MPLSTQIYVINEIQGFAEEDLKPQLIYNIVENV